MLPALGGVELIRQLRANGIKAPAMIISGQPVDLDGKVLRELDVRKTILKPFSLVGVLAAVNLLTGCAPAQEEDEA